jgi:hypothetical protein
MKAKPMQENPKIKPVSLTRFPFLNLALKMGDKIDNRTYSTENTLITSNVL